MPKSTAIKPSHKAIEQYHQSLQDYRGVGVRHEGALETAFSRLLEQVAKLNHCQLIPKHKLKVGANLIYPDGTIFEKELGDLGLRLGYWEAKDIDDDLDKAIAAKVASMYPLNNTIFENTKIAVLYQAGKARDQFDLADKKQLAALLNEFFAYHEPEIANFHDAVAEFKEQVPELARRPRACWRVNDFAVVCVPWRQGVRSPINGVGATVRFRQQLCGSGVANKDVSPNRLLHNTALKSLRTGLLR